jgi:AmmeMemoRadiSam system protein B
MFLSASTSCSEDIQIVPILVGAISTEKETSYGKLLAPYLADPETVFVVSSDFCHWSVYSRRMIILLSSSDHTLLKGLEVFLHVLQGAK